MKSLLFIFICMIISVSLKSQYKYGEKLNDSTILAINSRGDFLYVGIDNPLQTNINGINNIGDFTLTTNNGILFFDSLSYIIIPRRSGKARIVVSSFIDNDTVQIGYRFFIVKNVPDPMLQIDTSRFAELDAVLKIYLLTADTLSIFISSDIIGSEDWFKINKYSLGYIYGGLYRSYTFNGNKLTDKAKQVIYRLGPGKEVVFNITVEGEGKLIKELPIYRLKLY